MKKSIIRKYLLMSFYTILINLVFAGTVLATTTSRSQNIERMKLDLKTRTCTLKEFFDEVEQSSEFRFFYIENEIDVNSNVSIDAGVENLKEILQDVANQEMLHFKVINEVIVVKNAKHRKPEVIQQEVKKINGKVTDSEGLPLPGASIVIKGTTTGVTSDIDGNFTLDVPVGTKVLVFSFVGMKTQEISVDGKSSISVTMEEESIGMDEVVVVGYGTLDKKEVTSSITSVKGDALITGLGGSTIATALQGKVPGLVITETSSPNASNNIQLRGIASVNASNSPLIVIDGIPGNDLRSLNQEDIESVDVLKDASAGAIYGTRAAAGVILITTKQAKIDKVRVDYTAEVSTESVRKRPEMLSSSEYVERNVGDDYGYDTDWYNALLKDQPISNRHVLTLSGGSKSASLRATFSTQDSKGITIGDDRKDYSGRINSKFRILDDCVEIKANAEYRQATRDQRMSSTSFNTALALNPTISIYDDSDPSGYNLVDFTSSYNPVADIALRAYDGKDSWLLTNASAKIKIIEGLSLTSNVGYQKSDWNLMTYKSAFHIDSQSGHSGSGYHSYNKTQIKSADAYLTYNKRLDDDQRIKLTGGYSFWERNYQNFNMTNGDFPVDGVGAWDMSSGMDLALGNGLANMNSYKAPRERLIAFFARANYSFKDKYMLMSSYRREGSSKFGKNNRWANFWAVSLGWRMSDESFVKDNLHFVSDLKLRAGYGVTGNNGFASDISQRLYTSNQMWPTNGIWSPAYGSKKNANADVRWEEKKELNLGIDYAFFKNRLYGKLDIYKRDVDNLLFEVAAPQPPMTHATVMKNIGNLENKGWEFEIGGMIVDNEKFKYSTSVGFSHNTSRILNMGENTILYGSGFPSPGNPGVASKLVNGSVIGQYYVFKYAGLNENGEFMIYDSENNAVDATDKTLIESNKQYVGNAIPKLIVSWEHTFQYKNFDASVSLRSYIKYDVFNQIDMYYGLQNNSQLNVLRDAYGEYNEIDDEKILSDLWLSEGTFLKIDAINLGYNFNAQKHTKYLEKARLFLTVRDLACFTKYNGVNPEVDITGLFPGFEKIKNKNSMYPQTVRFTMGVQLTF
uniref:SusC/RagA family TonB-linked outer membrane protein n=1 Tax=uncultured Draconibacterium sp. TaxID=1573823 RepID=UPI003217FC9D